MKSALGGLLISLLVVGCAGLRPEAPREAAVTPASDWREPSTDGPIDPAWWTSFGDPALDRLVTTALAHNVDVAIAAERVTEARAQFALAADQRLPELVGTVGIADQRSPNPFGRGSTQDLRQGQIALSYELDLFGRLRNATAAARATLEASQDARDVTRLAVASAVVGGYVGLRTLDARLELLRATLAAREASLTFARRRADSGYGSELEASQADAEFRATRQQIPATELAIRRQEDALGVLLGEAPHPIERGRALDALVVPVVPVALPATVLRQRPDIAQAERAIVAADRSLDVARAAFMPRIQLIASRGVVDADLFPEPIRTFSLGSSVLAPIFESGRLHDQADVAASRRDQAAFAYRRAALVAFREVEDALAAVRYSAEQESDVVAQREALARTLVLATSRYRAGYATHLEQLDAQRGLLAAELALVQLRSDRLIATIALSQATGGGWRDDAAVAATAEQASDAESTRR